MRLGRRSWIIPAVAAVLASFPLQSATAACHVITIEGDPYTVGEASGSVTITVSNNGGQGTNQTVDYRTIDGTARAGSDYVTKSGTLTFPGPPGDVSFEVPIKNDSADEPAEMFTVELSNPEGICPGANISESSATVTITDNDPKPIVQPAQTQASSPKPKSPTATPRPSVTTASPSPSPSATPTPTPTDTGSPVAAADAGEGGLSGGAIGGIIAAATLLGGAAAFWVRRRFLATQPPS